MARLIDTSILVELERRKGSLGDLASIAAGERIALASITASELFVGLYRSVSGTQRQRRQAFLESVLSSVPVISFDLAIAETHAQIAVKLAAAGQSIGSHDLMIAATALTQGYDVLTRDIRHFARVPELSVIVPDW